MEFINGMMKKLFSILLMFCFFMTSCSDKINSVCIIDDCFEVELAVTPEQRSKGLMYRKSLDEDKGMLFIFENSGKYGFWMKNTLIPLDIIWIDENKTIIYISENTPPCKQDPCPSYIPNAEAKYVLELNAGISNKTRIKIGDKVFIS